MPTTNYKDPISWPFLPVPQPNGQLAYDTLEQSVRDSIRIILTTRPGEQLMQPFFGAGLQNFLDDGNTITVRRQIQTAIVNSLQTYESRIAVDNVEVEQVARVVAHPRSDFLPFAAHQRDSANRRDYARRIAQCP